MIQYGTITVSSSYVLLCDFLIFHFLPCFAVKHTARPSTKLTLVLLAKFRPYDVKMSHAMRIKVGCQ